MSNIKTFRSLAALSVLLAPEGLAAGLQHGFIGSSTITSIVHKQDCEGAITIDPVTGNILTLLADRPEWAEGLTVAQITQRHKYYEQALGEKYSEGMKAPEIMAFEDLDWLAVRSLDYDDEQTAEALKQDPNFDGFEHIELSADEEYRASVVATVLELKGDLDAMEQDLIAGYEPVNSVSAERADVTVDLTAELLAYNLRSQEEIEQLEESRRQGMKAVQNG